MWLFYRQTRQSRKQRGRRGAGGGRRPEAGDGRREEEQEAGAANEPKRFVPIGGADHNCSPTRTYLRELGSFFEGLANRYEKVNDR